MSETPPVTTPAEDAPHARVNAPSAALVRLAHVCGIATEYTAWNGEHRTCSARAIRAALAAMGIEAGEDAQCQRTADRLAAERLMRPLPAVTVLRASDPGRDLPVTVARGASASVTLTLESGMVVDLARSRVEDSGAGDGRRALARIVFRLPSDLPVGYHTLEARVGEAPAPAVGRLIVSPDRIPLPEHVRAHRPWGFMTQLYSLRSRASWGLGDLVDLRDLCVLATTRAGADFVLVNPLHAAEPAPPLTASPYLPSSRLFVHPLYIRVEDIPEVAYLSGADRQLIEWNAEKPREASRSPALLNRDAAWRAKIEALEQVFTVPRTVGREAAFQLFRASQGMALEDFATWCVIAEQQADADGDLPHSLASPGAPEVASFRLKHRERIAFHEWMQWIADEQRAAAQDAALRAGMRIGVMTDLAVGVHPRGADVWAQPGLLASGIGTGAPPDMYNQRGQDWSQPPWLPRALEDARYEPFRAVVRAALRHAGALRIDHILGLFRLWWVPEGLPPSDGVYVRYDHEALLAVLMIEATRADAMVIGEDLGTVEPSVADALAARGILGTTVAWFEREDDGSPRPPEHQRADVLATATTHDLPPTAAYLAGEHVDLRERLGLLARPAEEVRGEADRERAAMVAMLVEWGWAPPDPSPDDVLVGLHRAVLASPALLVGVALTDTVGDVRVQNQPGTDGEHPNWCIPLCDGRGIPVTLDALFDHPRTRALVQAIREARR